MRLRQVAKQSSCFSKIPERKHKGRGPPSSAGRLVCHNGYSSHALMVDLDRRHGELRTIDENESAGADDDDGHHHDCRRSQEFDHIAPFCRGVGTSRSRHLAKTGTLACSNMSVVMMHVQSRSFWHMPRVGPDGRAKRRKVHRHTFRRKQPLRAVGAIASRPAHAAQSC